MLKKRVSLVFKKQYIKYFCTIPQVINKSPTFDTVTDNPRKLDVFQSADYFNVHKLFTVKDLFDAKVHYGHKELSLTHNMKPFVFGSRLGHIIFDLDITAYHLREALNFTAHIAYLNGIILFISRNPRMTLLVENTAKECNEYALTREWRFGTFTNAHGINPYLRLPDLCIMLNTLEENGYQHMAVQEAAKMCIPTIGIVDSNCIPNLITYPVPGNDDSLSCFQLYCELFKKAILSGKNMRKKHLLESSKEENKSNKQTVGEKNSLKKTKNNQNTKEDVKQ